MNIKIVSSCLIAGEHAAVGAIHSVEDHFGRLLISMGKAIEHAGEVVESKANPSNNVETADNPPVVETASAKPIP